MTNQSLSQKSEGIALSVNLNKIALIRNSREGNYPNVKSFGALAIDAGARGLTVHPRPDQRHIRPSDVDELAELIKNHNNVILQKVTAQKATLQKESSQENPIEFNIEGNPFAPAQGSYPGLIELIKRTQPDQATLVPDNDQQLTSDHGFDLTKDFEKLIPIVEQLKALNVRISLFMDPDPMQIELAKKLGADRIELYTGPFAWAYERSPAEGEELFARHVEAANTALDIGLGINAGHDLNLNNMQLYKTLPGLQEVSIGHALTVDSLRMGMKEAIQHYLKLCAS